MLKSLRIIAFLEGVSLLLLFFVAMPLKYLWGNPQFIYATGMAHGVLFIGYSLILLWVFIEYKMKFKTALLCFIASFIPFGTFYADKHWFPLAIDNSYNEWIQEILTIAESRVNRKLTDKERESISSYRSGLGLEAIHDTFNDESKTTQEIESYLKSLQYSK